MDYFLWHNVDKYLKEKFGEKVYNRMWAYVFIAIYVVYLAFLIKDISAFNLSSFISITMITIYYISRDIFELYYVVKFKKILYVIVISFLLVIPTCTYFWAGSEDYLRVAYAFTQCVVLKQEDIVFISPKLLEWKPTGHRAVYYDIYMLKKQPTVKKMMEVIGSALGEVESYTYVDYYKPLGKYADTYDIVINDQSTIIFVEKHVEYDILMVDIGEIKGD